MVSFGESVKKGEPCDHADGKECGWRRGPGEVSGNAGEIDTQWLQDLAVPLQRNANAHRHHHVLYKDTWIEFMGVGVGSRDWGENKAREEACKARSEEYDSLNPMYLRAREVMQKKIPFTPVTRL